MSKPSSPLELAICASSRQATLATRDADGRVVAAPMDQAKGRGSTLIASIAEALANTGHGPRDIARILIDRGPGSYTGLRVALTFARTLHAWTNTPVFGVTSLELATAQAFAPTEAATVLATMDAHRNRLHGATLRVTEDSIHLATPPAAQEPATWTAPATAAEFLLATKEVAAQVAPNHPNRDWPTIEATTLFDPRLSPTPLEAKEDFEPLYLMGSYAEPP